MITRDARLLVQRWNLKSRKREMEIRSRLARKGRVDLKMDLNQGDLHPPPSKQERKGGGTLAKETDGLCEPFI